MKNKETLIVIVLVMLFVLIFTGCASRKQTYKKETKSELHLNTSDLAENELVFDYIVDTTKQCETSVLVERIEFYPDQYFDTTEKALKPKIKAVERKTINNTTTSKGVSVADVHETETTIKEAMKDSTGTEKVQAEKKDVQKAVQWWWLLVIAAAIVFIVRHIDR